MRPSALAVVSQFLWLSLLGCGPEASPPLGSQGALELLSPPSPLGLQYGERVRLRVRYLLRGEPRSGTMLTVTSSGDLRGSTLSAARLQTDQRGEAGLWLMAGAAEAAYKVLVNGPDAPDLVVDVAVSERAFGSLQVALDRRNLDEALAERARVLRASLLIGTACADLAPTARPPEALRSLKTELRGGQGEAQMSFTKLLLQGYTAVGRAEDEVGRLLGWGCVEVPEVALLGEPEAQLPLPLRDVYPRPIGTYALRAELLLDPAALGASWEVLACPLGAGQGLLDAVLTALPAREMPLKARLGARRGTPGADRCRPPRRAGEDTADLLLDQLIASPGMPGEQLRPVAKDLQALARRLLLSSRLSLRGETRQGAIGDHRLLEAELQTVAAAARFDLAVHGGPVLEARDLLLPLTGPRLDLPTHGLTLRLPSLWRQALSEKALAPRGATTVERLVEDGVAAARYTGRTGCAAVEALLCDLAGPPCAGVLAPACGDGARLLMADLAAPLRDGAGGLDLSLAGFVLVEDPAGTLIASSLGGGQAQGTVQVGGVAVAASGPLSGTRP